MLNRKETKLANGATTHSRPGQRAAAGKEQPLRRRFIISSKAAAASAVARATSRPQPEVRNGNAKAHPSLPGKGTPGVEGHAPANGRPVGPVDVAETIKTLLHLAHENGHVTYDDINDVLPEGMTPEELDQLY